MLFRSSTRVPSDRPLPLRPFLFRIRDGYLLGLAMDPAKGAPCSNCVGTWLKQRNVWIQPADLSELRVRRELLGELIVENNAHVFYEITNDGSATRLDCLVFAHPDCQCNRDRYVPPTKVTKKTNFAFSPISQIKCARFGTPEGNLWLTEANGFSPLAKVPLAVQAVEAEKESSRLRAVEEWMKKAAMADLDVRFRAGEVLTSENLQTGKAEVFGPNQGLAQLREGLGAVLGSGSTKEEASLEALYALTKLRTLRGYASHMKNPMLIVGTNNWIRGKVPFFLLQDYDLHLLFYPNSTPAWVVGIAAVSRARISSRPIFAFGTHSEIGVALDRALHRILALCRPPEWKGEDEEGPSVPDAKARLLSRMNLWWTHWIYRCPKISLKDVLHLESYPKDLAVWRDYYRDGESPLSLVTVNHGLLPSDIRHIVRISVPTETPKGMRNVNGIATWMDFTDALA